MKTKLLNENGERTYVLVFDAGDEALEGLRRFAEQENITAAQFTAIGAFQSVRLGWFDLDKQDYETIALDEQVEVLSLAGNIAIHEDHPKIHAHVVVGKRDGTAHGGHLMEGRVRPTLEVMLVETPSHLRRKHDPQTGLALIDPKA
ncbi:MAG: DNA-binding protein [Planctomycetes bacterium]|nr:DNA-binding protein [Planctomycetota bacterium]